MSLVGSLKQAAPGNNITRIPYHAVQSCHSGRYHKRLLFASHVFDDGAKRGTLMSNALLLEIPSSLCLNYGTVVLGKKGVNLFLLIDESADFLER